MPPKNSRTQVDNQKILSIFLIFYSIFTQVMQHGNTKATLVKGEKLMLLPEKAIYWKKQKALLLADLHLGKVTHFRKAGFAVPIEAKKATLNQLEKLLLRYQPIRVYLLGDLFHSDYNQTWLHFNDLLEKYSNIEFVLIEGNHDILDHIHYENSRLTMIRGHLQVDPFLLSHEPVDVVDDDLYNLCGHLHPAVRLRGKARQSMKLACFYFGDNTGILPAFGTFTGTAIINPLPGERVYVLAKNQVLAVASEE